MPKLLPPIHPGETIQEDVLKPLGMSATQLAEALAVDATRLNGIVHGRRGITADTALRRARRTKKSRSQLFSDAITEYVARHAPEAVTDAMDRVCSELGNPKDEFVSAAARRVLQRSEW